ncbi:hypothetical protein BEP19_11435 [Ammoniphilus oxalaticus]|uniref:Uncharacterized protein n=1 Tax=Ammoniphilus oxalaticus TaxID=66863 RepID=A0A419SGD1_9BACL|nr:spore germination protein [Ammoniphilus oxalaticus]RKD22847.1 hypothetical protein BEP19_11435 [Ammoniphilus oxalaticus]
MRLFRKKSKQNQTKETVPVEQSAAEPISLSTHFSENIQYFKRVYQDCDDVVFRSFLVGNQTEATIIYIDGLANTEEIDARVLSPLMNEQIDPEANRLWLQQKLAVANVTELGSISECIEHISAGSPVLVIAGEEVTFSLGLTKWERRSVNEPTGEAVVRGPKEGFTESIGVNTALLRRRIKSPKLKMRNMKMGRLTQTDVVLAYIQGIADPILIDEATVRLERIDIDGILEGGYIEELIQDHPVSPFPQILNTERTDVAVSSLLEGRFVILVDGTPFTLVAPVSLYSFLQSSEDYYGGFWLNTAVRWLRYLFLVISLLFPSLYVAVLTFHQEMTPTSLLISIASSREQVPFPALIEALIMEITFEALREAGIRLPSQVGPAVGIVGALVIGQAAVQAGIVSAPMVMVVAITGIASFAIPRYAVGITFRLLRFPMILLAGTMGLLGIMLGIIMIIIHLCSLRSFGIPYLAPMAPMRFREMKDVLIRAPWWMLNTRPDLTDGPYNKFRQIPRRKSDTKEEKR